MTREEALALLSLEADFDAGDLQDALDEQLFELKRFFTSRAPIQKLFQSRLDKLQKLKTALETLGPAFVFAEEKVQFKGFPQTGGILDVFQVYQQENRRLKTVLTQSSDPSEIYALAVALTALEKEYASFWAGDSAEEGNTLVSKENDPMEILAAIKAFAEQGGTRFEDLKKKENTAPETLLNEMKRLSLLFFKY